MKLPEHLYDKLFQMKASRSSLLIVNGMTALFAVVILYFTLVQGFKFNLHALLLSGGLLVLYFIFDTIQWKANGIQMVEVDKESIRVYRGDKMKLTTLRPSDIKDVDVFAKLNRRVLNIMMEGAKKRDIIPGFLAFFTGPRVRITNDAFDEDFFEVFISLVKRMKAQAHRG